MSISNYFFTSESVTEGHPDKVADQISDAILDAILAEDPKGRVACETMVTTGLAMIAGEITTSCYVDMPRIVRGIGFFQFQQFLPHLVEHRLDLGPIEAMAGGAFL